MGPSINVKKHKRSTKLLAGAALLLGIGLLALLLATHNKAPKHSAATKTATDEAPSQPFTSPPPRIRTYKNPAEPPVIDEIVLEKTELCAGEEFLVTVKAHSVHPDDDIHLHAVIDGKPGMRVPLIAKRNRSPDSPKQVVAVFGRSGKRTMAEIPPYVVKDCVAERALTVDYRLRVNTNAEYEFSATILNLGNKTPFKVESYVWDFGDGTTETTKDPTVIHDFGRRKQESLYSNMLVRVEARSNTGETLAGRRGILIRNAAFSNLLHAGVVTLVVELTPRFPTIENGVVTQGIRLWHHRSKPLEVKRLRSRRNSTASGSSPVIAAESITGTLGTTTIPPSGIEFKVTLDASAEPNLRSIDFLLDGVSAEGLPVKSVFSVMRPADLPTPESHQPVSDPLLTRKIIRARKLLRKDYVTDEDIWRLQRQGKFDDLQPTTSGPGSGDKLPPVYTGGAPTRPPKTR